MAPARHPLRRLLTAPLMLAAAVVVLFEEVAWQPLQALAARLARLAPFAWIESRVRTLGPYGTLALFLVPLAGLFPVKLMAVWLIGSGHPLGGLAVLLAAKVTGTAAAARLYAIGQDKLLSIGWFAWSHAWVLALQARIHRWLHALPGWDRTAMAVQRAMAWFRAWRRPGWLSHRFAAARRWCFAAARRWWAR